MSCLACQAAYHTFAPVLEIAPPSDRDTSAHVDTAEAAVAAIADDDIPDILSCDLFNFDFYGFSAVLGFSV